MSLRKKQLIESFDPNGVGQAGSLFGLPFDRDTSEVVVIPVPWDVTTSYHDGASLGPQAILKASPQIDLCVPNIPDAWQLGITMLPIDEHWKAENARARTAAIRYINFLEGETHQLTIEESKTILLDINKISEKLNEFVFQQCNELIADGKIPVVVGGDHSSPYGLMNAISDSYDEFGVLQIDAHADLRNAYQGFNYSHASIMHNLLKFDNMSHLVQVGVRDFCEQELNEIHGNPRITTYFDFELAKARYEGERWQHQVNNIISSLPQSVYITLDVDGLEQSYCPSTGTPVPGGLSYNQLVYLLERLMFSGKKILGFDICEVSGAGIEWDAIVGARLLYHLANITAATHGLL